MTNTPESGPADAANTAVLVVDDDTGIRRIYCRALGSAGHHCHGVGSSAEALQHLQENAEIDVVVSDIRMPGEDGITFLRHIRERFADRPWLQVLLITGVPSLDDAIGGLRLQARDLLEKPVRLRDLIDAVERAGATARRIRERGRQHDTARATIARLAANFDEALERFAVNEQDGPDPVPAAGSGLRAIPGPADGIAPEQIERLLRWQRNRNQLFQERYFSDPAWYMLLDLYLGEVTGRETSVTSLCLASDVPVTTALRRIDELEEDGVLARRPDQTDGRRIKVALRPEAHDRMTECLVGLLAVVDPLQHQA